MANPLLYYVKNIFDPNLVGPLVMPGLFQAGATKAITRNVLLERTADSNTRWVPIDSDHDASAGAGLAIANQDIASGDLAGYYEIIVPRPGDVFKATLAAASAVAPESAVYYATAGADGQLTLTPGTNILGYTIVGAPNFPGMQRRLSQAQLGDPGETHRSTVEIHLVFRAACSFYKTLQKA